MRRTILYFILFFQITLIVSLVRGAYGTLKSRERITQLEEQKANLEFKRRELERKMAEVQSGDYLERVARDELHLSKPGETVVIVPESLRVSATGQEPGGEGVVSKPNWRKWWEVVSGKIR